MAVRKYVNGWQGFNQRAAQHKPRSLVQHALERFSLKFLIVHFSLFSITDVSNAKEKIFAYYFYFLFFWIICFQAYLCNSKLPWKENNYLYSIAWIFILWSLPNEFDFGGRRGLLWKNGNSEFRWFVEDVFCWQTSMQCQWNRDREAYSQKFNVL